MAGVGEHGQPYLIDARRLIDAFAETDAIIPPVVFAQLSLYLRDGVRV